ncbi:MAG: hypothetical protein ABI406_00875, partial [Ktedonobacteraceae bacterium]
IGPLNALIDSIVAHIVPRATALAGVGCSSGCGGYACIVGCNYTSTCTCIHDFHLPEKGTFYSPNSTTCDEGAYSCFATMKCCCPYC